MTTAATRSGDDSLAVTSWLAELHMECYKKNLEDYDTVKVRCTTAQACECTVLG